jgi:hypothetical protein
MMEVILEWPVAHTQFEKQSGEHYFADKKNGYHRDDVDHG